jgi:signal transduction histidine kinase
MADLATHSALMGTNPLDLGLLDALAGNGNGSAPHRSFPPDPSALLGLLESAAESVRQQIAQRRQAEECQLRDQKLRALAELAAGAAHEINNPLAVISGQAQHLLKTEESLERAKALERIVAQCKRINHILTDLMFFARPPKAKLRAVPLAKVLAAALDAVSPLALERRIALTTGESPRLTLQADRDMLESAIACLLTNAVQAAPTDGWVRLTARPGHRIVELLIEDNGPGLSAREAEHLFDPFFSGRSAGRGAGLGLPKVWRIAEQHSGSISFTCESGKPTRFVLTLPATETAARAPRRALAPVHRNGVSRNGRTTRKHR